MKNTYPSVMRSEEKMSFLAYRKLDKSNVKDVKLVLGDPLDFNDYGSVKVKYKNPIWKKYKTPVWNVQMEIKNL